MLPQDLYDPATFRATAHELVDQIADYLAGAGDADANSYAEPEATLAGWRDLLEKGAEPAEVFRRTLAQTVHIHSPRYAGHQNTPPAPLAALSDLLGSTLNASTAVFEMGRAGAAMERLVIETFAGLLELDDTAGGFLTSGGTLANLTALLAARAARWPAGDPWQDGQENLRPCVLVNEQAHYCIDRAVRIMGWGEAGVVNLPTDDDFRLRTEAIDDAVADARDRGLTPLAIVGSACTTATGSFDDLNALADAAERHELWFHVDGAHGAPVRLDPDRAHLVAGLERADSLIMDFHKMLMCPALTTAVFFRRSTDAYATFRQKADYLLSGATDPNDWSNFGRRTFECTKNNMALRVFTLLACHGPGAFRAYVRTVNDNGRRFANLLRARPDFELALDPQCNIVCFRYRPLDAPQTAGQLNELNALVRAAIVQDSPFYLVQTKLRGRTYLRCTLTNPLTTEAHLNELLDDIAERAAGLVGMAAL